jgi:E3 ubiquitin-protein ligase TRIP12
MKSFGISISRCLFDERVVDLPLSSAVYKYLFSTNVDVGDLESFDEAQSGLLKTLLRCPGCEKMGLTFEFVDPDDDTVVNDLNKELFVAQKIEFELVKSREQVMKAIFQGFWSLAALHKPLKLLGWRECVVLLSGSSYLSPEMVLSCLKFDGFPDVSPVPQFLVDTIKSMTMDLLRLFMFFCTEQPSIPFGGLRNPRQHQPVDKITVKPSRNASHDALPTAQVCFYTIVLPAYPTIELLKAKLELAIRESGSLELR